MYTKNPKPELLAPAGTMQSFNAALMAGADAVYLGLASFNARRNAENFELDDLRVICDKAHLAGRRIYLTLNTLILDDELEEALELVAQAWQAGIDAVIVADWGLLTALARQMPQLELHTSTQMNIHTSAGIELARNMGATRVTLARELSLDELAVLAQLGVELEVFAHGALCICCSGQCLMSSLIGRRSANRGLCAQPCRLPWTLMEGAAAGKTDGGWADSKMGSNGASTASSYIYQELETPGEHLLSPKDLCTIDILPELIASGVASLKIEGRMKSPEYVAMVVGAYRSALDRAYADPEHYSATAEEHAQLEEAFSRGFTTAYLQGARGNDMMSYRRPNNRGVMVGRVADIRDGLVELACERALNRGDVLEFWTSRGRNAQTVERLHVEGREVEASAAGERVSLVMDRPVAPGDRVFRVRNARFVADAKESFEGIVGVPCEIDIEVVAHLGEPLVIRVCDRQGRSGAAEGPLCEKARTHAVSSDDIETHVGRLGGTPYMVGSWDIQLDEGVGMGFSQLHALRREALAAYEEAVLEPWHGRVASSSGSAVLSARRGSLGAGDGVGCELGCIVASPEAALAAYSAGAGIVYVPALVLLADPAAWEGVEGVVPLMPTVAHDDELDSLGGLLGAGVTVVADSSAMLAWAVSLGAVAWAGPRSGAMNAHAAVALQDLGACGLWLSPELSLQQIAALAQQTDLSLALTVFGRQELMVTEHCVLMAQGACAQNCSSCVRRMKSHALRDRKGYEFPVLSDAAGRGHVYNAVTLDAMRFIGELREAGVSHFIVDAGLLAPEEAARMVTRARKACKSPQSIERIEGTTTGHLFRGVL